MVTCGSNSGINSGVREHNFHECCDYSRFAPALQHAHLVLLSTTQVGDGFFIKHTADTNATVAYLVLMHRHITARYGKRPLVSKGEGQDALLRKHPTAHLCATFEDFTALTVKTPVSRVDEMFVKQLVRSLISCINPLNSLACWYSLSQSVSQSVSLLPVLFVPPAPTQLLTTTFFYVFYVLLF